MERVGRWTDPLTTGPVSVGFGSAAFFVICLLIVPAPGLHITKLQVPTNVDLHSAASLTCQYDLEGARLYSVKWYKDDREFYRYMPDNNPKTQTFPLHGVALDLSHSSPTQVTLHPLTYNTSGLFRCEVSTEAPKFNTVYKQSNMTVIAIPKERPTIEGIKDAYVIGEDVSGNCTSSKSYPPAELQWFINGKEAEHWQIGQHDSPKLDPLGLHSTTLGLRFKAEKSHFLNGDLQLRCKATVTALLPHLERAVTSRLIGAGHNQKLTHSLASPSVTRWSFVMPSLVVAMILLRAS